MPQRQALAIIDDVVEGKLAADELAMIHGIPEAWIEVTPGHVTRTAQGAGRVQPLDVGGWYATGFPQDIDFVKLAVRK